jgi:hypothetical protein
MSKTQSCVPGYGATAYLDFRHTVGGNTELTSKLRSAYAEFFQIFSEMFPWMYDTSQHYAPERCAATWRTCRFPHQSRTSDLHQD